VKPRAEIKVALEALGWTMTDGPTPTSGGYKATIQRENESMLTFAATEMEVLEDLLKRAQARAEGGS
jgi:hypothetical protein